MKTIKEATTDLFGNEVITGIPSARKKPKGLFDDYEGFVDKFKPKHTTDDCYTPPDVYNCILEYVRDNTGLENMKIIRPFFPGGDYENVDYPDGCAVIDNPPFSILAKIVRFYLKKEIPFFLFAPHLTLFSPDVDCTAVVCGANIIYGNGAVVNTSFLSNMFGNLSVLGAPELYKLLNNLNASREKVNLPKYRYPPNVLTVSMLDKIVWNGIPFRLERSQVYRIGKLDCQKKYGKAIFGHGFLLSAEAAALRKAAQRAAQQRAPEEALRKAAQRAAQQRAAEEAAIEWELSGREWDIVRSLK